MFRRAIVAAALLLPGSLLGQDPASVTEKQVIERIEELAELRHEAQARRQEAVARYEAARTDDLAIDSVQVGPFWLLARADELDAMEEVAREAWADYEVVVGDGETVLDGKRLSLEYHSDRRAGGLLDSDGGAFLRRFDSKDEKVAEFSQVLASSLRPDRGYYWLGGGTFWMHDELSEVYQAAYREFMTTDSRAVRGCIDGDLADCWRSVGLLDMPTWWESWYTPEEVRPRVLEMSWRGGDGDLRSSCRNGDTTSCLDLAAAITRRGAAAHRPLHDMSTLSLTRTALDLGGTGSLTRLRDALVALDSRNMTREEAIELYRDPEPLILVLVEITGLTRDELAAEWRNRVLAHQPKVLNESAKTVAATTFWIVLLMAFSTRSTRWERV